MNAPPTSTNALSCKVVLLGESGVGKTSIISRYINNSFDLNSMSTTGASFAAKTMHFDKYDKSLKFEIWDTAGQEKYRALTKIFYKDASVAILVYDITRKQSFEEIQNYWIHQLRDYAPKKLSKNKIKLTNLPLLVIAIAANKSDLYESEDVSEEKARAYAKEIGAIYKLTSAKNATGVEELFKAIGNKFFDPTYEADQESVTSTEEKEIERLRKQTVKITKGEDKKSVKSGGKCC